MTDLVHPSAVCKPVVAGPACYPELIPLFITPVVMVAHIGSAEPMFKLRHEQHQRVAGSWNRFTLRPRPRNSSPSDSSTHLPADRNTVAALAAVSSASHSCVHRDPLTDDDMQRAHVKLPNPVRATLLAGSYLVTPQFLAGPGFAANEPSVQRPIGLVCPSKCPANSSSLGSRLEAERRRGRPRR